jgi:GNAT superfamily N-acetyltransferase
MTATNIRRASANDAETIARIVNEAWKTAYAGVVPPERLDALSGERKAAQLREGLIRFPEMRYYLFEADGAPVGAASLHPTHDADLSGAAEFSFFYFLPSVWRRGYGTLLLGHLKSEAVSLGYSGLCCWVLEQNRRAIAFYESQDMPRDGKRQTVTIGVPLEVVRCVTHL